MSRVDEILSWYGSDHPGVLRNLRLMMDTGTLAGTGKMVILPVDQGFEHGPARTFAKNSAGYDPLYHYRLAIDAGCNAYAAPLGALEAGAREFAGRVPTILKLNSGDSLFSPEDPKPAITGSVDDALRLIRERFGDGARFDQLSRVAAVAVNRVLMSYKQGRKTRLSDGDTLTFVKAAAGG